METAIVMPLFVFILLGLLQLGLMHQARLMTKYAAYKAVRAGSINRGKKDVMTTAAMSVLLPILSRNDEVGGLRNVSSAMKYGMAFNAVVKSGTNVQGMGTPLVDVVTCHPTKADGSEGKDFDNPKHNPIATAGGDWRRFETTKLAIQVTLYYRMFIPFANAFVWWAAFGQESESQRKLMKGVLRTKSRETPSVMRNVADNGSWTLASLRSEAEAGRYIMPIRASYSLRMMSNFAPNTLPERNLCRIPWKPK